MRKKICFIVAAPGTAQSFLRDHISNLSKDYDIYIAGNIKNSEEIKGLNVCGWKHIDINRKISLWNDIKAVFQLRKYFSKLKFDAVHSVTPKAGLTTALAGLMTRIPVRIHIFTGQAWANMHGVKRQLLKSIDKLIAILDTNILIDGMSQRQYLIDNHVVKENKSLVLGYGSICGVNTTRFAPQVAIKKSVRTNLGIGEDKIVFVFLGRLNKDKGLYELLPAFDLLASKRNDVYLVLFGNDEENVSSTFDSYNNLNTSNFKYYGVTREPEKMLQAGDIFVLPTYREGFGSSVIEAQCLGMPVITSDAYGVLDASVEGETGLRCKVRDIDSLYQAMLTLVENKELRERFGKAGRTRVLNKFSGKLICHLWLDFYKGIFQDK